MDHWRDLRAAFGSDRTLIAIGAGALVLEKNAVLLQRRRDGGDWGLPGGAKEPGETLEETARRELFEETGLIAKSLRFLTVCSGLEFTHTYPNGNKIEHVAAIYHALEVERNMRPDERETLELRYFGLRELPDMQPLSELLLDNALESLAH